MNVSASNKVSAKGHTVIPNEVVLRADLSLGARLLYGYLLHLAQFKQHGDTCEPPIKSIAAQLGVGKNQVTQYARELAEAPCDVKDPDGDKLLVIKRSGQGKPNLYVVNDPRISGSEEQTPPDGSVPESGNQESRPSGIPTRARSLDGVKKENLEREPIGSLADIERIEPPPLRKVQGRNLAMDALAEVCDAGAGGGRGGPALNGQRRAGEPPLRAGIRRLVWEEMIEYAKAHGSVAAMVEKARLYPEAFEAKLADMVRERAAMYRKAWPRTPVTPQSLCKWWPDLPKLAATADAKNVLPSMSVEQVNRVADMLDAATKPKPVTPA